MKPVVWSQRLVDRFKAKVEVDPVTGCWNWTGFRDKKGYGRFQYGTRDARLAYNVSYGLFVGPLPDDLQPDHTCRNTSCVNPDHLDPVTPAENMRRAAAAKTHCPHGHPYDEVNTYISPNGARVCRTCRHRGQRAIKDRQKAERAARGRLPRTRQTHCQYGHPFDEDNTYVTPNGVRRCRACHARRERERQSAAFR